MDNSNKIEFDINELLSIRDGLELLKCALCVTTNDWEHDVNYINSMVNRINDFINKEV